MLSNISSQYEQMWKMFIRPMKGVYSIHDLGPFLMTFAKFSVLRTDFSLKSSQNFTLQCSLFQIQGEEGGRSELVGREGVLGEKERGSGEKEGGRLIREGRRDEGEAEGLMGCILYLHGNAGNRLDVLPLMPFLVEKGFNVCCFDFAGCGLSEGEFISLGMHESQDASLIRKKSRDLLLLKRPRRPALLRRLRAGAAQDQSATGQDRHAGGTGGRHLPD